MSIGINLKEKMMLKKFIVLFIFLSILSFRSVSDYYNTSLVENYNNWNTSPNKVQINFRNIDGINQEQFVDYLATLAEKYDLTIGQNSYDKYLNSTVLYIFSENIEYMKNILLNEGEITQLKVFQEYSTNNKIINNRIFNLGFEEQLIIRPLKYDGIISPFGYFGIYTNDGEGISFDIQVAIKNEITNKYENIIIDIIEYDAHETNLMDLQRNNLKSSFVNNILFTVLFILIMITDILNNQKLINVMKLNGYSNLQIYNKLILKNIIISFFAYIFSTFIIFIIFIPFDYKEVSLVYNLSFILAFANLLLVCCFTFILYSIIKLVSINISIKGKSYLLITSYFLGITKLIVLIVSTSLLISNTIEVTAFIKNSIYDEVYEERYNNLYKVSNLSIKTPDGIAPYEFFESQIFQDILYEIQIESNGFYFFNNYIEPENGDNNINIEYTQYYTVDRNYVFQQIPTLAKDTLKQNAVYINNKRDTYNINSEFIDNSKYYHFGNIDGIDEIYYDGNPENFGNLFFYDESYIIDKPIFLLDEEHSKYNGLFGLHFYFDGSIDEANEYINSKFNGTSVIDPYIITSVYNQYETFSESSLTRSMKGFLTVGLIILIFITISFQNISIMYKSMKKRTFIEYSEGYYIPTFIKRCLKLTLIILSVFFVVLTLKYKYQDVILYGIITTFVVIEILVNSFYVIKVRKLGGKKNEN